MIRSRRSKRFLKPMAEINVVPYIDVMLVLLVIFMITTPLISQGVKVNLPKAQAQVLSSKDQEPIIVSVDAQGNYYLNIALNPGQSIDQNTLVDRVSSELQHDQAKGLQRQVLVKGDQNVDYGKVVQAMILLQHAGAQSVGLMTDQQNQHAS